MLRETILIVEDDAATRAFLAERIEADLGLAVAAASTLQDAGKLLSDSSVCIAVILDVGMPDGDGRDFCIRMRREGHKMPIIMLTGSDSESDVLRGLDAGAERLRREALPVQGTACPPSRTVAGVREQPGSHPDDWTVCLPAGDEALARSDQ